ncbi:MAG: hypothetical protein HYT76_05900 [Deltaproteobacteria bacterium]|nr:hypothetical protein [Deltaproteobacteria bacterium]
MIESTAVVVDNVTGLSGLGTAFFMGIPRVGELLEDYTSFQEVGRGFQKFSNLKIKNIPIARCLAPVAAMTALWQSARAGVHLFSGESRDSFHDALILGSGFVTGLNLIGHAFFPAAKMLRGVTLCLGLTWDLIDLIVGRFTGASWVDTFTQAALLGVFNFDRQGRREIRNFLKAGKSPSIQLTPDEALRISRRLATVTLEDVALLRTEIERVQAKGENVTSLIGELVSLSERPDLDEAVRRAASSALEPIISVELRNLWAVGRTGIKQDPEVVWGELAKAVDEGDRFKLAERIFQLTGSCQTPEEQMALSTRLTYYPHPVVRYLQYTLADAVVDGFKPDAFWCQHERYLLWSDLLPSQSEQRRRDAIDMLSLFAKGRVDEAIDWARLLAERPDDPVVSHGARKILEELGSATTEGE